MSVKYLCEIEEMAIAQLKLEQTKLTEDLARVTAKIADLEDDSVDLLEELFKDTITASAMGKLGGSKKSEAKSASSRANGKLGGRPKKVKDA